MKTTAGHKVTYELNDGSTHSFITRSSIFNVRMYLNDTHIAEVRRFIEWDGFQPTILEQAFLMCENLTSVGILDTSKVTNMRHAFVMCRKFDQDISYWDTFNVVDMSGMFTNAESFNSPIYWDTRNVKDMSFMFANSKAFNSDLDVINVSKCENFQCMFRGARSMNQPLDLWDVSSATNFNGMFLGAYSFAQNLNAWNPINAVDVSHMFRSCQNFNDRLDNWKLPKLESAKHTFIDCPAPRPRWYISHNTRKRG